MARIIRIGKTNWLAGMSWRSFEDRPSKADITDDAKQLNAQWYAVRVGESAIQGGFCMPPDGCKTPTKLYSLAAMLADSQKQPWLGIFKIDDGIWWYIAVRDGHAILPDGDLIGDETTILAARERHSGYADWNYIEGDATELSRIIDEIKLNKTPVKSLVQSYSYVSMGAAVVSLIFIASGIWWYIHTRQTAQAQARIRAAMSKKLPPPVISPMLTTPDPAAWLMACGKTIGQTPLSMNGWLLTGIECQTNEVNLTWKRGMSATVADMPGGALLDNNIVTSTSTISAPNGKNDAIAFDDAKRILIAGLQRSGIDVQIIQIPVAPPLPGQSVPPTTTTQITSQPQVSFRFNTLLPIFELKLNTPGVRFTRIKFTGQDWQVEGILYGK
jgi:hypothetical protein